MANPGDESGRPRGDVRNGQGGAQLDKDAFAERFRQRSYGSAEAELARLTGIA